MPLYLTRFSYTPETWGAMIERPEDRRDVARQIIESVGGKLQSTSNDRVLYSPSR